MFLLFIGFVFGVFSVNWVWVGLMDCQLVVEEVVVMHSALS